MPCCVAWPYDGKDIKYGRVIPVWILVEKNGYDKSDTDDSEQCIRCDWVTPRCVYISNNACYHNFILP